MSNLTITETATQFQAIQTAAVIRIQLTSEIRVAHEAFDMPAVTEEIIQLAEAIEATPEYLVTEISESRFWSIVADHELPMQ